MNLHGRSWLHLLAFFALASLSSSLILAALFTGVTVVVAGHEQSQEPPHDQPAVADQPNLTFSGVITDAHCGGRHTRGDQSASACARMCVRNGSAYMIVDGDKAYELTGDIAELDPLAGQRVTVTGVLNGNVIRIQQISALRAASQP